METNQNGIAADEPDLARPKATKAAEPKRDYSGRSPRGAKPKRQRRIQRNSLHSTHAHSALAVVAEVSKQNAASSEALRPSRIIAYPPRQSFVSR
jgi:hypothetical protein